MGALGLRRPLLVGHSLGAAVVAAAAIASPGLAAGVVLVDGDALVGGRPGCLARLVIDPFYTAGYRLATRSDFLFRRLLANAWGPGAPSFDDAALDAWQQPFRVQGTAAAFRKLLSYGIQGLDPADLARLKGPRLVVWGAADAVDSLAAGRRTAAALHARIVVIPDAGHLSMLARPQQVAAAIAGFAAAAGSAAGRRGP